MPIRMNMLYKCTTKYAGLHSQYWTNYVWDESVSYYTPINTTYADFKIIIAWTYEWACVVVKSDREYYNDDENSNVFNTS